LRSDGSIFFTENEMPDFSMTLDFLKEMWVSILFLLRKKQVSREKSRYLNLNTGSNNF